MINGNIESFFSKKELCKERKRIVFVSSGSRKWKRMTGKMCIKGKVLLILVVYFIFKIGNIFY